MNEWIFLASILLVAVFSLFARHFGLMGLVAWVAAQSILSNIFVLKQIKLFGLHVTSSEVYTLSGMFTVVLIQEYYGKAMAKKAINAVFVALVFLGLGSQLHLAYLPAANDTTQSAYETLFGPNLRIVAASIFAYWVSQRFNIWIFEHLSQRCAGIRLSFRGLFAVFCAQTLDTVLFAYLGLYGLMAHLEQIMLFGLCVKTIGSVLLSQVVLIKRRI